MPLVFSQNPALSLSPPGSEEVAVALDGTGTHCAMAARCRRSHSRLKQETSAIVTGPEGPDPEAA